MIKKVFFPILCLIFINLSCTKEKTDVYAACELTPSGTYLIKWETYPPLSGNVKIYESSSPDSFNMALPITERDVTVGYQYVLPMPYVARTYFKLVFNRKYSTVTSNRIIPAENIHNFRDMGGYQNKEKKQTRWGKLYRSGTLALASILDLNLLNQLKIKTIIDFRTERDSYSYPLIYQSEQVFNFPLRGNNYNVFLDKVVSQKMKRSDVILYSQGILYSLLENNVDYFMKMFDILLEEDNYPVIFFCSQGKDRSAIAASLILAALDMDKETIINDYMQSNDVLDDILPSLIDNVDKFNMDVQETITILYRANKEYLTYILDKIEKDYGSTSNYLEKELKLTNKKRDKLKEILLYE
ncbi:MAG: tyrosine-protein phosphatase [Dysgonamonadaceae bacterium]|jgi:protein-tyrosine phosphatase|nr:tyrosine-protein phosphatase [Dysgonamonadaceae bacterium]